MFWADRIASEIITSHKYLPYWVDDMKTPSGRVHVGSLRGVLVHDLVYKAVLATGATATFSYVFEDHDPMDGLPFYLDTNEWSQYLGKPLFTIPSPDKKAANYARYFATEFEGVFNVLGCNPDIIWMSEVYKMGKMNEFVRLCLDNAAVIRTIYEEMYKKKLRTDWYPFQLVCPHCGKESTTQVTGWDGNEVTFICKVDAVDWTKGCGTNGSISPFSDKQKFAGKLPWKVEWPVKWKVIGVTIEGAGKDHMSAGGSHDIARRICERVLNYPVPYAIGYEFFLIGGKKMSSSKGLGSSAYEVSEMMPPYLVRFLFTRTDYRQAIEFDPLGTMAIPDLFDEYDRCRQAFVDGSDPDLARAFELSQTAQKVTREKIFLPRFRDVANLIQQPGINVEQKFASVKGSALNPTELEILAQRQKYAGIWIEKYAPDEYRLQMHEEIPIEIQSLTLEQKNYLGKVMVLLTQETTADQLQQSLYLLAKDMQLDIKKAFAAIYISFIGKTHGPRAGGFLLQYPKEKVIKRLEEASK